MTPWQSRRSATLIAAASIGFAIVVALVLLVHISWNRDFQVDEVEHLHAAYDIRDGRMIYRDFVQSHPPLLHLLLLPLTSVDDPVGTFHRGRLLMCALLIVTVVLSALAARRLANGWAAAATAGLLLFHTTFIERGMEVRPDGALALCIMAALLLELTPSIPPLRRHSWEALILGTGTLLTQKALFPVAAFGIVWIVSAWRERRPHLFVQPALLVVVPMLAALGIMAAIGNAREFLHQVPGDAVSAAVRAEKRGTFGPMGFVLQESARNLAFVLCAIGGLIYATIRRNDRGVQTTLIVAAVAIVSLWANPFPWPYIHVTVIPLLAVLAGAAVGAAAPRSSGIIVVVAIVAAAATAAPRLFRKATASADVQFFTLREIGRITRRSDHAFDLVGLYFRPDAYRVYNMSGDTLRSYRHGTFPPMLPELRRNAVAAVMFNYRTAALPREEKTFIGSHFTRYTGDIFLPGIDLTGVPAGEHRRLDVLAPRRFRVDGAEVTVDGVPFRSGALTAGVHDVGIVRGAPWGRLIADTPPPVPRVTALPPLFSDTFD